jgi:hypothetical protein
MLRLVKPDWLVLDGIGARANTLVPLALARQDSAPVVKIAPEKNFVAFFAISFPHVLERTTIFQTRAARMPYRDAPQRLAFIFSVGMIAK